MKTKITLLLSLINLLVNAQVTEIYVPSDYFVPQSSILGSSFTLCQKNGFLYVASTNSIGGRIFKVNQNTNQVTPIIESSTFNLLDKANITYLGEYNDKIFFRIWQNGICMLDTTNNTLTTNYLFDTNFFLKNAAIFNGYVYNGSGLRRNINTGTIENLTYFDGTNNVTVNIQDYTVIGNEMIGRGDKLFKFDVNGLISIILNNATTVTTLPREQRFFKLNNKYIYMKYENPSKLNALSDILYNEQNLITAPNYDQFSAHFILSNKLYFTQHFDGSTFIKRTDASTTEITNIPIVGTEGNSFGNGRFSSTNSEFIDFTIFNNKAYTLYNNGNGSQTSPRHLISYDGNSIQTLGAFTEISGATVYNNQLYFQATSYVSPNNYTTSGIYKYDGINIYKLDLGNVSTTFATIRGQIFGNNNYLFYTNQNSVVKIDLNTINSSIYASNYLSVNQIESIKSKLITFPNPSKNNITIQSNLNSNFKFKIVELTGRIVESGSSKFNEQINIESLENGNYIIQIETENGEKLTEKVIKN